MYFATILKIENLDIITGIDKKQIDRIETINQLNYKLEFENSQEFKAVQARNEKVKAYNNNIIEAKNSQFRIIQTAAIFNNLPIQAVTDEYFTVEQRDRIHQLNNRIQFNQTQIKEIAKDLPQLMEKLQQKEKDLIQKNAIYFGMPENSIDLSEEQAKKYTQILNANEIEKQKTGVKKLLTLSGETIIDNRGKIAWMNIGGKWTSREITSLTDKVDVSEILDENLIKEEREIIEEQTQQARIDSLTEEEKQAEIEALKRQLLTQSVNMKNELEIQGDPEALKKSQEWYKQQITELEAKYQ